MSKKKKNKISINNTKEIVKNNDEVVNSTLQNETEIVENTTKKIADVKSPSVNKNSKNNDNNTSSNNKKKKSSKNSNVTPKQNKEDTIEKEQVKNENTEIKPIKENEKKESKEVKKSEKVDEVENNVDEKIENSTTENPIEETNNNYTVVTPKKSHKGLFVISFILIALVTLFLVCSTVFALVASHQKTIIKGTKIKDIDVSGLTREQAIEKVTLAFNEKLEKLITLKHNDYETQIYLGQFDVSFAIEEAVNIAFNKGRTRKYFSK